MLKDFVKGHFFLLLIWSSMLFDASAYPSQNYGILKTECVERTQRDFNNHIVKRKETKITVNGKQLGYYGFENSANSVILLDVSNTNVQLPKMNISFTNLIMLHASFNGLEKIDDIGNETFPSLKFLNLSHNAISNVKSYLFTHLNEIEILDLSHNCFVHFKYDNTFLGHENLKKIYLHDNLLHQIRGDADIKNHMLRLDLMDLSGNLIETFNDMDMQIKELKLSNNSLKSLHIYHADDMKLFAPHNHITSFIGNENFSVLDLSNNEIKFLSQVEIKKAKVLNLAFNNIEAIAMSTSSSDYELDSFDEFESHEKNSNLQPTNNLFNRRFSKITVDMLDLSFNKLRNIEVLSPFSSARSLELKGNSLKNIDIEDVKRKFPNLTYINFIGNPLSKIDIDEMKFHNDTRFLNIHIDYELSETLSPLLSTLTSSTFAPKIVISTTESQLNSTQSSTQATDTSTQYTDHKNISILKRENIVNANRNEWHSHVQHWIWIFGVFISIGFFMLIIYSKQQRNKTLMRYMNREFNEAANFF